MEASYFMLINNIFIGPYILFLTLKLHYEVISCSTFFSLIFITSKA